MFKHTAGRRVQDRESHVFSHVYGGGIGGGLGGGGGEDGELVGSG